MPTRLRPRRTLAPALAALAALAALPAAPRIATAQPSPPRDSIAARVAAVFAPWSRPGSPGCAVAVRREGDVVLEQGFGYADLEHDVPFTAATVSEAGSVTKQVVALAALLLAQDGTLSLDDDVRRWVPELPDYGQRITLRMLVQHTSGLRDMWALVDLVDPRAASVVQTLPEVVRLVARQRALNFAPGSEWLYSNSGYALLATTIERASGQTLNAFATARIFGPMGMTRTQFRDDHTRLVKGRATAYAGTAATGYRLLMPEYDVVGSGGMLTTVGDLLRLEANYATGAVGGRALVDGMADSARLTDGRRVPYAYGLTNGRHRGLATISHGGSTAGYRAFLLRVPSRRSAVTLLCNVASVDPEALALRVADAALGDLFPEPPAPARTTAARADGAGVAATAGTVRAASWTPDAGARASLAGRYASPELGVTHALVARGDTLVLRRARFPDLALRPVAPDVLQGGSLRVEIARGADGRPAALLFTNGRARRVRFDRVAGDRAEAPAGAR